MKYVIYGAFFLIAGCTPHPDTGRTGIEEFGYQWECAKGLCPPPKNAPYELQLEYAKVKAMRDANELKRAESFADDPVVISAPTNTTCRTIGSSTYCSSY